MSQIHALSGAYAVDALDDAERAEFERHLAECAECRAEVASLQEAAGHLAGTTEVTPPAGLRDRVLADIKTVRPLPPVVARTSDQDSGATPAVAQLDQERRRRRTRLTALVAAAAVVATLGVGGTVWHPWTDDTSATVSAADTVLNAPDARRTSVDFDGGASATVVHSDSVGKAVIVTHEMPPPPQGKVYQLWLLQPGAGMVPAGLMPVKPDQTVVLQGNAATAQAVGITVEPAGGSTTPSGDPIAQFDFGAKA